MALEFTMESAKKPVKEKRVSVKPIFGLADIPDDWEIRFDDDFVEELDKLNRPWRYDSNMKQGVTRYWYVGSLRKRTLDKMSAEEKKQHKRELRFYERMWGWKTTPKYKGRDKRGIWIVKDTLDILRQGIDIEDSELEKVIMGFRFGMATRLRAIQIGLPIVADKWWAWVLGFYYATASMNFRSAESHKRARREQMYMHFRAHNPVCELAQEIGRKIGLDFYNVDRIIDRREQKRKTKGLRTRPKPRIGLGWPGYLVLKKFGLSTFFREDHPKVTSRYWKPVIPDWVLGDDECMLKFIEGSVNGIYGMSAISRSGKYKQNVSLAIYIRITGTPEEYIKKFTVAIRDWLAEQGLVTSFRKFTAGYAVSRGKFTYEITLSNMKAIYWFLDNLEIVRPDLRARLFARIEARDDAVFHEALKQIRSPYNVILGMLLESPRTMEDVYWSLQMRRGAVTDALVVLQKKGLVERRGNNYYYAPEEFIERTIKQKGEFVEILSKRVYRYSTRLLYRCTECFRVYVRQRKVCGRCAGPVDPIERSRILQSLHSRRAHAKRKIQQIRENAKDPGSNSAYRNRR